MNSNVVCIGNQMISSAIWNNMAYHAIREKLRHPGRALDLKTKDLIGHL